MDDVWHRLPDAPRGRTLGPDGPHQCTFRAQRGRGIERCGDVYGHAPLTVGIPGMLVWSGTAVEGHEPWPEDGAYYTDVGGHRWRCDRGPLSICDACGLPYARWDGGDCPALPRNNDADLLQRVTRAIHDADCEPDCTEELTTEGRYGRMASAALAAVCTRYPRSGSTKTSR